MYLFPRECPRILLWPTEATTCADKDLFWQGGDWRTVAFVEQGWLERFETATLYRYDLPPETFESLDDAGMWISHEAATPLGMQAIGDLPKALAREGVDLRALPSLAPLKDVWSTTLHASGIRLRNASDWPGR
jgi:hypothetical protein